ncbi:glyoxylate/hydroxypyruvate reductase GhrA [Entomohabitans teleogrylli]|uniref:glyoxylate/hydroxypyruvate reductase GhrA n=1 Tax=Entomohabitans teleogrylli TaxID=1384589 RepID=UPI00073D4222|nr:glyoxylate/hydroxypyruvate reductase GhrA [Entomohabitans teleogrylli]
MDIIFHHPTFDASFWLERLQQQLPQARLRVWQEGDNQPADYALVWRPPVAMLNGRRGLKAVFALGAGVDSILSQLREHPGMLAQGVLLYRLEDTGMGLQMQEYAVSQVLHWFRRFDDYQRLKSQCRWEPLEEYQREDFTIGVLGAGVLGGKVAESMVSWGFPVRCWSRSRKHYPQVASYAGAEELPAFLAGTRVLINLLPDTQETRGIINRDLLQQLVRGAYVLNLARGTHVVEDDLLAALDDGQLNGAMLDVFSREPLAPESPLWRHPRVAMTPHIAAVTRPQEAIAWIRAAIRAIENGDRPGGEVNLKRGY